MQEEIEEKSKEMLEELIGEESNAVELENIVEESKVPGEAEAVQAQYGKPLEDIYHIATPGAVETMDELRQRVASGNLSEYDRARVGFYEEQFSQLSNVEAAYIRDEEARINVMKIKDALDKIKQYKTLKEVQSNEKNGEQIFKVGDDFDGSVNN